MNGFEVVDILVTFVVLLVGWLFKMIKDNRDSLKEMDVYRRQEHNAFLSELKAERVERERAVHDLHKAMADNCAHVNSKIEEHKLYVANNYIKEAKIEQMMRQNMQQVLDHVQMVQSTLNILISKINISNMDVKPINVNKGDN